MSHRFRSCHKIYFFDVYENKHGNHYLKLTQSIRDINSTADNPQYFRETLHIYEDSIYEFFQHFKEVIRLIEQKNKNNPSIKKKVWLTTQLRKKRMSRNDICMFVKKIWHVHHQRCCPWAQKHLHSHFQIQ